MCWVCNWPVLLQDVGLFCSPVAAVTQRCPNNYNDICFSSKTSLHTRLKARHSSVKFLRFLVFLWVFNSKLTLKTNSLGDNGDSLQSDRLQSSLQPASARIPHQVALCCRSFRLLISCLYQLSCQSNAKTPKYTNKKKKKIWLLCWIGDGCCFQLLPHTHQP